MNINGKTDEFASQDSAYPMYAFDDAILVSKAVFDLGGARVPIKKEALARQMNYAPTGPSFVHRIAAAKCFGIIRGRGEYTLTEIGKQYFLPKSETDKSNAAVQIVSTPKPFALIFERFRGMKVPDNEILANVIHDESNVPRTWASKVVNLILRSARSAGMINVDGVLLPDRINPEQKEKSQPPSPQAPISDPAEPDPITPAPPGTKRHVVPLPKGREIIITAPEDMNRKEIERVQRWMEVTLLLDWEDKTAEGAAH